jgi:hypothetical protein
MVIFIGQIKQFKIGDAWITGEPLMIKKAQKNPNRGPTPARGEGATASGTKASATVSPDKISFFGLIEMYLLLIRNNSVKWSEKVGFLLPVCRRAGVS